MSKARSKQPAPTTLRVTGASGRLAIGMLVASCVSLFVALNPYGGLTQPTDLPLVGMGATALCAALLMPAGDSFAVLVRWRVSWALAALAAWALVSAVTSGRLAGATFGTNGTALGWPIIAVGTVVVLGSAFHAKLLRPMIVWVAIAVLLVEFVATAAEAFQGVVPGGTLSNSSNTGAVVVLLLPLVLWSALRATKVSSRAWRLAVVVAGVATLVVGDARTSMVALAAAAGVWGVLAVTRRRERRFGVALWASLALAVTAAAALVLVRWPSLSQGALGLFYRQRAGLWEPALRAIALKPVAGWGPDGYQFALARVGDSGAFVAWQVWLPPVDPHNLVLWLGVSLGIVGIGLAGWIAYEVGRSWRLQSRVDAALPVGPVATGVTLYAVSALTSPVALQTLPIALVVLGASLRPEAARESHVAPWLAAAVRWSAVGLAVLVGAYGLTRLSVANRLTEPSPIAAQRAASLWSVDPYLHYNASLRWGYAAQATPALLADQRDLVAIRRAVALEPANWLYQLELARTMGSYGMPQTEVDAAFKRAVELGPTSPEALAAHAEYLIAMDRLEDAKALLDRTRGLAPSSEAARIFAVYYRAIGNEAEAARYDQKLRDLAGQLAGPNGGYR